MIDGGNVYILKRNEEIIGYYYSYELQNIFNISRTKVNEYADRNKTIYGIFKIIKTNKKNKPNLKASVKVGYKKYKPFITYRNPTNCNSGKTFWLPEWKRV